MECPVGTYSLGGLVTECSAIVCPPGYTAPDLSGVTTESGECVITQCGKYSPGGEVIVGGLSMNCPQG